jgi:hypothetical protein
MCPACRVSVFTIGCRHSGPSRVRAPSLPPSVQSTVVGTTQTTWLRPGRFYAFHDPVPKSEANCCSIHYRPLTNSRSTPLLQVNIQFFNFFRLITEGRGGSGCQNVFVTYSSGFEFHLAHLPIVQCGLTAMHTSRVHMKSSGGVIQELKKIEKKIGDSFSPCVNFAGESLQS